MPKITYKDNQGNSKTIEVEKSLSVMEGAIQNNIPGMAGNTSIIVAPEHGRNLEPNNIKDANAFYGYDHSDSNARRIFNLMAGPGIDSNLTIGSETNGVGDIVNITPTIAEILGFKQEVINSGYVYNNNSFFDLI